MIVSRAWLLVLAVVFIAPRSDAQTVGGPGRCQESYRGRILGGPVPDDPAELLVAAQLLGDGNDFARGTYELTSFAERREWLRALGEPRPHPASVREIIDTHWSEDMDALRRRGAARILGVETLAVWDDSEPVPHFAAPAENEALGFRLRTGVGSGREAILFARFRVDNRGQLPVSAVTIGFLGELTPGNSGAEIKNCRWRPLAPLQPGESREVACEFEVLRQDLPAWRKQIETQTIPTWDRQFSMIHEVSLKDQGRDIPSIPFNMDAFPHVDPDIARMISLRRRAECQDEGSEWGQGVLVWILLPGALGGWLGRRWAR